MYPRSFILRATFIYFVQICVQVLPKTRLRRKDLRDKTVLANPNNAQDYLLASKNLSQYACIRNIEVMMICRLSITYCDIE